KKPADQYGKRDSEIKANKGITFSPDGGRNNHHLQNILSACLRLYKPVLSSRARLSAYPELMTILILNG
ncbi:hypothetical protein RCM96_00005, partial [Escherichia coli]|nr:hypothetical protein [Escherichia coli]